MDIEEWKRLARSRIESGAMSEEEWDAVLEALLRLSEDEGIALFDDAIAEQYQRTAAKPQGSEMSKLREAIQTLGIWIDMWSDEQSDRDELDDCDAEERKVIAAARLVMKSIPSPNDYVAWLRWNGHTFVTCDSDSPGAFRVCRHPDDSAAKPQWD